MTKQERIKKDQLYLKEQGYKKVVPKHIYDYYKNMESAVTIYVCKIKKQKTLKMIFPNKLNPVTIWESIKDEIKGTIIDSKQEFTKDGLVYNVLCKDGTRRYITLIRFNPLEETFDIKEVDYNAN